MVEAARASGKTVVIDFQVEQEDTVYPMVPAGAALDAMIRRPSPSVRSSKPEPMFCKAQAEDQARARDHDRLSH